jgi:anti-sigma regulatory factor (Ser/Thr protein kinase)
MSDVVDIRATPAADGLQLRLELPNDRAALEPTRLALLDFLAPHEISAKTRFRIELILEEVLMNLVWHAFADGLRHQIEITVQLTPDEVSLQFDDGGLAFNPLEAAAPARPQTLGEAVPGGLGLMLLKRYASQLVYERMADRNHLTVSVERL